MHPSDSRHISVLSSASPQDIYFYAREIAQLPTWASGLASGNLSLIDANSLHVDSPMGTVHVEFVAANNFGVLDHTVTLPDNTKVLNPFRIIAHPEGTELIFSVRQGDMSTEDFEKDCAAVAADLFKLVSLVEEQHNTA